jgi:flagellar biosynthesis component FlhA
VAGAPPDSITEQLQEDLRFHGYTIIQHTIHCSTHYLMAVKKTRLFFLYAKKVKRKVVKQESVATQFAAEIQTLAKMGFRNCQRQLWLYADECGWKRYTVYKNGTIAEVERWARR